MEKSYIFVLYVNGKICKAYNWFCENERVAHLQAIVYALVQRPSRKRQAYLFMNYGRT